MPQPRRRSASPRRPPMPNWLWLLLGLLIGIAAVVAVELLTRRDGLGGLFAGRAPPPQSPAPERAAAKPRFDFYTILPETETVLSAERELRPPKKQPAAVEQDVSYVLQAASYASFKDADELKARLALLGLEAHIQKVTIEGKGEYHRVRLGPYARIEDLDAAAARLQNMGLRPLRLKVKKQAGP